MSLAPGYYTVRVAHTTKDGSRSVEYIERHYIDEDSDLNRFKRECEANGYTDVDVRYRPYDE